LIRLSDTFTHNGRETARGVWADDETDSATFLGDATVQSWTA